MRIRLFHAFASNNSGSYTMVGSFRDASTAEEVARLIQEVSDEHHAWHEEHTWDEDGESPLDGFVRREGLRARADEKQKPGRGDAWPQHGDKPTALATGSQVFIHAPYTVTMPAVFGEFIYSKGGRVEVEIDHSHDDIAVEFSYYPAGVRWDDPKAKDLLDAFEARAAAELPVWTGRSEHDRRPAIAPVFHKGFWGSRHLSAVFGDLVEGVQGMRRLAREAGMEIRLRLWECPHNVADPLIALRAPAEPDTKD
jgi:hypothetical protein